MATDSSDDHSLLTQLDWQSHEILRGLYEHGGTATTSEIKHQTRITDTDPITYRFRRAAVALEPSGLIEVHEPELTASQRSQPLEATLTEQGEALAERVIERDGESSGLDERLEKIEATLTTLEETLDEQDSVGKQPSEDSVADLETRVETVEQRLDHLEQQRHSEFGAWSAEKQHEHEAVVGGTRAVRDFLLDEYGERFKTYITTELE